MHNSKPMARTQLSRGILVRVLFAFILSSSILYNLYQLLDGQYEIRLSLASFENQVITTINKNSEIEERGLEWQQRNLQNVEQLSEEEEFRLKMQKRMKERKDTLQDFCSNYTTSDGNLHTKKTSMFSSRSSKLTFCIPPKTGSMSIKKFLFQIEGDVDERLNSVGHGKFSLKKDDEFMMKAGENFGHVVTGSNYDFKSRTTVLVARHAFSRLVSAYWSKIGPRKHKNPYFDPITRKIVAYYRGDKDNSGDASFATFVEFVDYITTKRDDPDSNEPHWTPIENYCNPCTIPYDVIIHTETLSDDIRYLAMVEGISGITLPPPYDYTKTKDAMKSVCEQLPESTILQALWKYKMDFASLGYDPFPCLLARNAV